MPMIFRFRWIPFVAALVAATVGTSLGQWQTRRALDKESIEAKMSARETAAPLEVTAAPQAIDEAEYRHVVAKGQFVGDWTVFLDNRPYKGAAGFYVLTPMRIGGTDMHVLVARGWVKRDVEDRARLPPIGTPPGTVEVRGVARRGAGHVLQLGEAEQLLPGAIVQNVDVAEFARASGLCLQPYIIEQLAASEDGLVRDWPRPSSGSEKHRGYAFQWYALAAMALIFFVVTGFSRGTK